MSAIELHADSSEVLFRQIHPSLIDNGVPDSSNFRPKSSDQNKLSIDRSSLTTADAARALYVQSGRESTAVYGLDVQEFKSERVTCFEDPITSDDGTVNPAHAIADYSQLTNSKQKNAAKRLKLRAIARGCLWP